MADREYMRKLIDEVLGADRNKLPDQFGEFGIKFTDNSVCKYYLVGFCPYLQFQNTKSDIGSCPKKYHEERLKDRFLEEGESHRAQYEHEFMDFLERLVNDLERRLRRGRDRLDHKPSDPTATFNPVNDEVEERRTILDLQVKELLARIETCGEEGRIQEAQILMQEVDKCKIELDKLRQQEAENPSYRLEKKMEVCPTCGAFLIIGDAQKRIESHFEGRQHNGWARIRETLADLKHKYRHGGSFGGDSIGGGGGNSGGGGDLITSGSRDRRAPSPEPGEIGEDLYAGDRYVPNRGNGLVEGEDKRLSRSDRGGDRHDRDHYHYSGGDDRYQHGGDRTRRRSDYDGNYSGIRRRNSRSPRRR